MTYIQREVDLEPQNRRPREKWDREAESGNDRRSGSPGKNREGQIEEKERDDSQRDSKKSIQTYREIDLGKSLVAGGGGGVEGKSWNITQTGEGRMCQS